MNKLMRGITVLLLLFFSVTFFSCVRKPHYVIEDKKRLAKLDKAWEKRKEFPALNELDFQVPIYAKYLKGKKICLDPGHGGDAHKKRYKRGPTDYREAVMNYKVAEFLREFLEKAGAEVKITRNGDESVSLRERVNFANEWGADFFLSIHHNAAGSPSVNRTTTWFHLAPDSQPSNLDMARYIQHGVADALRLPQIDGVPLKSDQLMYKSGFGVLRGLNMTSCLCEASFFTNPYEEYRLKKESYLKREAYGQFLGFCRYSWGGFPKADLVSPEAGATLEESPDKIVLKADTGFTKRRNWGSDKPWIFTDSVCVRIDGEKYPARFDKKTKKITAVLKNPLDAGPHEVVGGFRNYNGNYSMPLKYKFTIEPPLGEMMLSIYPQDIVREIDTFAMISVKIKDKKGQPVRDGRIVTFSSQDAKFESNEILTENGKATAYIFIPDEKKEVLVKVRCGELTKQISFSIE
jgi:N-acetylmuramoyl-L-alanine amidase